MRVGVFDSGVGGLTVLKAIEEALPNINFVYIGDTARTPYGIKSTTVIKRYTKELIDWFNKDGINNVILACNTASAVAKEYLKEEFPNMRIIDVIIPAVNLAISSTKEGRVGVIGTSTTINSNIYQSLLQKDKRIKEVFSRSCPLLVPIVEEGLWESAIAELAIQLYLKPIIEGEIKIDTLILACTHYPILIPTFKKLLKGINLIDSASAVAKLLKNIAEEENWNNFSTKQNSKFYVTDAPENFSILGERLLNRRITAELLPLKDA